ncbi:uncharacterized protein EI90DRAFT_208204 [Cantharellus anzutake]|uniref:uncharacterized protein n=1 Tax=Cantharellus anzutake TaxID=1750568 RepID=UPI0019049244|nr:uncharacterized protein EI90DRAFT_208204 [Cantharellus anzutake]KAF8317229.1 hypothetical protein EI90DRAFT_208204 [Cantharellus anzutake]
MVISYGSPLAVVFLFLQSHFALAHVASWAVSTKLVGAGHVRPGAVRLVLHCRRADGSISGNVRTLHKELLFCASTELLQLEFPPDTLPH